MVNRNLKGGNRVFYVELVRSIAKSEILDK